MVQRYVSHLSHCCPGLIPNSNMWQGSGHPSKVDGYFQVMVPKKQYRKSQKLSPLCKMTEKVQSISRPLKTTTTFILSIQTPQFLIILVIKFEQVQFTAQCCV